MNFLFTYCFPAHYPPPQLDYKHLYNQGLGHLTCPSSVQLLLFFNEIWTKEQAGPVTLKPLLFCMEQSVQFLLVLRLLGPPWAPTPPSWVSHPASVSGSRRVLGSVTHSRLHPACPPSSHLSGNCLLSPWFPPTPTPLYEEQSLFCYKCN